LIFEGLRARHNPWARRICIDNGQSHRRILLRQTRFRECREDHQTMIRDYQAMTRQVSRHG
jgi:hypothetical protein